MCLAVMAATVMTGKKNSYSSPSVHSEIANNLLNIPGVNETGI